MKGPCWRNRWFFILVSIVNQQEKIMIQRIAVALGLLFSVSLSAHAAEKVITITPQTKYVNVNNGDKVTFMRDGKSFTWNVRTLRETDDLRLSSVAPAGFDTTGIEVFVDRDPTYR
jgi:hypothetical protein